MTGCGSPCRPTSRASRRPGPTSRTRCAETSGRSSAICSAKVWSPSRAGCSGVEPPCTSSARHLSPVNLNPVNVSPASPIRRCAMSEADDRRSNRELASPHERYDARLQRRSSTLLQQRVVEQERASIAEALDLILADDSIARAAARIVAARRRFIVGSSKSFSYASLLAFALSAGLSQVSLIDGTVVRSVDVLSDVRSSDLMVAFSLRRYRRDTVEIARRFAEAGGELV